MSFAEKILQLTNPTPTFNDPEDQGDETSAKLTEKLDADDDNDIPVTSTSDLRRKTATLLQDEDRRYAGKAISRKTITEENGLSDGFESSEDENESEETSENDTGESQDDEKEESANDYEGQIDEEDIDTLKTKKENTDLKDGKNESDESDSGSEDMEEDSDDENESDKDALEAFKRKLKKNEKEEKEKTFSFNDDGDFSKYADDYNENNESDSESESESEENQDEAESGSTASEESVEANNSQELDNTETNEIMGLNIKEVSEEVAKGQAASAQLGLWDSLLEGRIRLQKALSLVNQLPQPDTAHAFSSQGGQSMKTAIKESSGALKTLLEKLVQLQTLLYLQYPQTQHIVTGHQKKDGNKTTVSDGSDEEITSDEDDDEESSKKKSMSKVNGVVSMDMDLDKEEILQKAKHEAGRKRKLKEYPDIVAKRHKAFQDFRDATIQKWHDKTRVSAGKINKGFSAFEQSTVKQIQQILGDRGRLVERTRLRRTEYDVLGKRSPVHQSEGREGEGEDQNPELRGEKMDNTQYNVEIFDDSDFYHQLLRELIERKTANVKDPIELSRQYIQMQSLRKKVKRKVDPKASKGRKVRYDIHPRLVNFMAPTDACDWADEARDDLFNSLFGQLKKTSNTTKSTSS